MKRKTKRAAPSRAIAVHAPSPPANPQVAFIEMLERAARDPAVDVSKMKELLAMRDAEQQRVARQAFAAAMVRCQDGMRPVKRNMEADRFKYASFEAVDDVLRPIYSAAGFALSYNSEAISDKRMLVICDVLHQAGYERRYTIPITVSTTGPKGGQVMTQTQGEGAAVSFGRRYLELMIFNIVTTEDDAAVNPAVIKISDAQLIELQNLLRMQPPINEGTFCAYMQTTALKELPATRFEEAKAALLDKRRAMAEPAAPPKEKG